MRKRRKAKRRGGGRGTTINWSSLAIGSLLPPPASTSLFLFFSSPSSAIPCFPCLPPLGAEEEHERGWGKGGGKRGGVGKRKGGGKGARGGEGGRGEIPRYRGRHVCIYIYIYIEMYVYIHICMCISQFQARKSFKSANSSLSCCSAELSGRPILRAV